MGVWRMFDDPPILLGLQYIYTSCTCINLCSALLKLLFYSIIRQPIFSHPMHLLLCDCLPQPQSRPAICAPSSSPSVTTPSSKSE